MDRGVRLGACPTGVRLEALPRISRVTLNISHVASPGLQFYTVRTEARHLVQWPPCRAAVTSMPKSSDKTQAPNAGGGTQMLPAQASSDTDDPSLGLYGEQCPLRIAFETQVSRNPFATPLL